MTQPLRYILVGLGNMGQVWASSTLPRLATVYACTWNLQWSEFAGNSQALITIEMENGVRVFYEGGMVNVSSLNDFEQDYWRAECDLATLELDQRRLRIITGRRGRDATIQQAALDQQPVWMNAWLAELFVDWLSGGPPLPNTLEDNIQCAALVFAVIASARSGQPVQVQDFLQKHLTG